MLDSLPASSWPCPPIESLPEPAGERPLVLVAEDEEGSRSALCEVLRDGGFRAVGVADGIELLDLVPVLQPAAVVVDLAMPRLNGMEAAAALRSDPEQAGLRIVAITASWLGDRNDLLTAAGFDGALRKPFGGDRLLAEICRVLSDRPLAEGIGG